MKKEDLKEKVKSVFEKDLQDEELLKLNELEDVEGGACALGCLAGCLLSDLKAIDVEKPGTQE